MIPSFKDHCIQNGVDPEEAAKYLTEEQKQMIHWHENVYPHEQKKYEELAKVEGAKREIKNMLHLFASTKYPEDRFKEIYKPFHKNFLNTVIDHMCDRVEFEIQDGAIKVKGDKAKIPAIPRTTVDRIENSVKIDFEKKPSLDDLLNYSFRVNSGYSFMSFTSRTGGYTSSSYHNARRTMSAGKHQPPRGLASSILGFGHK